MNIQNIHIPIGDEEIIIETGKLAKQADGAVTVRFRNAVLLATVVANMEDDRPRDFLPLSVDYQEKFASNGRIPGGFLKREGPLSIHEILICRLVDRAIRPLFPDTYRYETQININLISADDTVMPDALACLAASAALAVSNIPVEDKVSELRIARIDGKWKINPSKEELTAADIDLIVGGTELHILMVEGECKEVAEEDLIEAIQQAHPAIRQLCMGQKELEKKAGATQKATISTIPEDPELKTTVAENSKQFGQILADNSDKTERDRAFEELFGKLVQEIPEEEREEKEPLLKGYFKEQLKTTMRERVLETGIRLDGRKSSEIRPIDCITDYIPSAHGSAVFTRGETQALVTVTLGSSRDEQLIDGATFRGSNNFMLHYNFPGFSTGEVKFMRGASRREVGHGNLALRSLKQVIPDDFPYTIRVVSDILESNGSSSMATVCGGSLSMMDAGIPLTAPVSGIAMGLVADADSKRFAILSDISADEDHLGDMDFKVTGTNKGICGCQMDLKTKGIPFPVMLQALKQARESRLFILDKMNESLAAHREDLKPQVPRLERISVATEDIGSIIGPGGKIIQELQASTGTTISVKEEDNKGWVEIFAPDIAALNSVKEKIALITIRPEVGKVYSGRVKNIMPFGAFVEIMPGKDGLVHISEISQERVEKVEDFLEVGDEVKVKLVSIDEKTGKLKLSMKVLSTSPNP